MASRSDHAERAQRTLTALGYDPGVVDGIAGPRTWEAAQASWARLEQLERQVGEADTQPTLRPPEPAPEWTGRRIDWIVIHGSASTGRTAQDIRDYHTRVKGWRDIGYHEVIEESGGHVMGRRPELVGAHARDFNVGSYGICMVGEGDKRPYRPEQLLRLRERVLHNMRRFGVPVQNVIGHREVNDHNDPGDWDTTKTCPGELFDCEAFREELRRFA